MASRYDVVVGGGSVAGLTFAAEAASSGLSVLVAEEHPEIGEPEKCDGLVSLRGLRRYGYAPGRTVIQNRIAAATLHSPTGKELSLNAGGLEVVVLDRSAYDKQLAARATAAGAELVTGARASSLQTSGSGVRLEVGGRPVEGRYYVDATGPSSTHRRGILPAAKYEISGNWVRNDTVELYLDAEKYPGFFAWVIPYGTGVAKVGAAGRGVNGFDALDAFLSTRRHSRLRRVAAPIYLGGPLEKFVEGRHVKVGEAAGQVKPTTAGGIMTSVAGAVIAARWVSASIAHSDPSLVSRYQPEWESKFLKEMKNMLRLRRVFEKLSNSDIDSVFDAVSSPRLISKLSGTDFDFHATAVLGALGIPGLLKVARVVASAEARALLVGN